MGAKPRYESLGITREEFLDDLRTSHSSGESLTSIACRYNMCLASIQRWFYENGIYINHFYSEGLHKRLGLSKRQLRSRLLQMYDKPMSTTQIAKELGANARTISDWFHRLDIPLRDAAETKSLIYNPNKVKLLERHLAILDGLMLGDGHLSKRHKFSSSYKHGSKYGETVVKIMSDLDCLDFNSSDRVNKIYGRIYWHIESKYYRELVAHRDRWYSNLGKKRVPRDLKLSKKTLYNWYIGDGSRGKSGIILCTDSFVLADVHFLCRKLSDLGLSPTTHKIRKYTRIYLGSQNIRRFYKLVGPCENPEYSYKWG